MRQLVLFQTGKIEFALDRDCISHIRPLPEKAKRSKTRVQQQTIKDEERSLILIDFAAASNHSAPTACSPDAEMIVVKASPPFALLADRVKSTMDVNGTQMDELPPVFGETVRAYFPKVLCLYNRLALVIDPDALEMLNTLTETSPIIPDVQTMNEIENNQDRPHPKEGTLPMDTPSEPPAESPLEVMVDKKLRQIIQQRVQVVMAETVNRMLKQHMRTSVTPPQPMA